MESEIAGTNPTGDEYVLHPLGEPGKPSGVVDIVVADEDEAVRVAKKYLAYFQGPLTDWKCEDQRRLRAMIPENRLRVYENGRIRYDVKRVFKDGTR